MSTSDDRPIRQIHFYRGVIKWIDAVRDKYRDDPQFTDDHRRRLDYIAAVLCHGNCGGRHNTVLPLPVPWRCSDIERVIGVDEDDPPASGTEQAWRAARRHYDLTQSGRAVGGRTI